MEDVFIPSVFIISPIVLGILHMLIFLFRPRNREYLYAALFFASYGATICADEFSTQALTYQLWLLSGFFILLFLYSLNTAPKPIQFWGYCIAAALVALSLSFIPGPLPSFAFNILMLCMMVELGRIVVDSVRKKVDGFWIIAIGASAALAVQGWEVLADLTPLEFIPIRDTSEWVMIFLFLTMAGYLSFRFALASATIEKLNKELEERVQHRTAQLKEANKQLMFTQFAVEHGADGAFWVADDASLLNVNESACVSLGYSREELLRMKIQDIDPDISTDAWHDLWKRVTESGSLIFESRHRRTDGSVFPVEVICNHVNIDGCEYCCSFVRDITARKEAETALRESEQRFRNVVESSPMGIHLFDLHADGQLVLNRANHSAGMILGIDHGPLIGKTIEEAFPLVCETEIPDAFRHVARNGGRWNTEYVKYRSEHINSAFDLYAFQNTPGSVVVMFLDITRRKQAEEEREKLEAQLRQAQKMEAVGQLAGGIAHDFNNLLQAISGYTQLGMSGLEKDDKRYLNLIQVKKAADRASELVHQLLAFGRQEFLAPKVVNLNRLISDFISMIQRLIGEDISLSLEQQREIRHVCVDSGMIQQVLINLCLNARDAMPGGGCITIATKDIEIDPNFCLAHPWAEVGEYVLLSVRDTGCGIPEDTIGKIFEPFFTTKEVGKGSGLGLSMVYGILKQHGALIDVQSRKDEGTEFLIYFPASDGKESIAPHEPVAGCPLGNEMVLVAEDEESVRELTCEFLRDHGYGVIEARDGLEALSVFQDNSESVDLAMLDIVMPQLGGQALASRIRSKRPDLPILFCSGYSPDKLETDFVQEKNVRVIQKPYEYPNLLQSIRDLLDS